MMKTGAIRFLPPIPVGYRIFLRFTPAGFHHYQSAFNKFYESKGQTLELEADPRNAFDENAIKVMGICRSGRYHLGFLSKDVAKHIAQTGLIEDLIPRIDRLYRSESDYTEAQFQLLGPKAKYDEFIECVDALPCRGNDDRQDADDCDDNDGVNGFSSEEIVSLKKFNESSPYTGKWTLPSDNQHVIAATKPSNKQSKINWTGFLIACAIVLILAGMIAVQ